MVVTEGVAARLRRLRQHSSAEETGSSSGSAEQIYLPPRPARRSSSRRQPGRPDTGKLDRPSQSGAQCYSLLSDMDDKDLSH